MAISTVDADQDIYTLWGLPRLHLPVIYFSILDKLNIPTGDNKEKLNGNSVTATLF